MAAPSVLPGTKLLILVGNGAEPEVFSQPCGLTNKSFKLSATTNSTLIPDCDDPEAPAWEAKEVNSLALQVTGTGVMAKESLAIWRDWFMSAGSKNCQMHIDDNDLGYFEGSMIISNLELGGQRGQKVTINVTIENDGAPVWVDN